MANTLPQELHNRSFTLQKVFEALPELYLLLYRELLILAANDACLEATLAVRKDLIGKHLFEAFPDIPESPDANGVANLSASLRQVLTTGQAHKMPVQHYDVPRP